MNVKEAIAIIEASGHSLEKLIKEHKKLEKIIAQKEQDLSEMTERLREAELNEFFTIIANDAPKDQKLRKMLKDKVSGYIRTIEKSIDQLAGT